MAGRKQSQGSDPGVAPIWCRWCRAGLCGEARRDALIVQARGAAARVLTSRHQNNSIAFSEDASIAVDAQEEDRNDVASRHSRRFNSKPVLSNSSREAAALCAARCEFILLCSPAFSTPSH